MAWWILIWALSVAAFGMVAALMKLMMNLVGLSS